MLVLLQTVISWTRTCTWYHKELGACACPDLLSLWGAQQVINEDPNVANIVKPTDNVPHDTMPAYPSQELIDAEKHVERLNLSGWMFGKVEKFMISRAWWWLPDKLQVC